MFATANAHTQTGRSAFLSVRRVIISNTNGRQKAERHIAALTEVQNIISNAAANIIISLDDIIATLIRVGSIELPSISHIIIYLYLSYIPDNSDELTPISMALVVK